LQLTVGSLSTEETWKDIVRIKKDYRKDAKGIHIRRGTICRITLGEKSQWVIVHGRETDDPEIQMDLNVRLNLKVKKGQSYDFTIEQLSWIRSLWFPWKASDPLYRVPAQLSLISFFLGLILGLAGLLVPFVQDHHAPVPQSSVSSAAPTPAAPAPAINKP
jgi:hypothetical protein